MNYEASLFLAQRRRRASLTVETAVANVGSMRGKTWWLLRPVSVVMDIFVMVVC